MVTPGLERFAGVLRMCRNGEQWNGLGIRSSRIRTAQAIQRLDYISENLAPDVFLRQSPKKIRAESLNELAGEIRRKTIVAFAQEADIRRM
jgi:hypothetical protein